MGKGQSFDDFLAERNDALDNAAHNMALLMLSRNGTQPNEEQFPWNMEIIGAILENTKGILEDHGYPICWPYYENDTPCVDTDSCKHKHCPLKDGQ